MKNAMMIMLLLLVTPFASAELITYGSGLEATLLYYVPVPAQPGDTVEVFIQIENNGGTPSKSGELTILEGGPFSIESSADKVKKLPSIPGRETFLSKANVRISKDANEGDNILKVRIREDGQTNYQEFDLVLNVRGTTSALSIIDTLLEPDEVLPGESAILTIELKNVGDTKVRNVDVALDIEGISLAPKSGSDSKTIGMLMGGQTTKFTFELVAFPDATPRAYQIPITLSYDDERGNSKSQEETVGLVVGTIPELSVYFESVSMSPESKSGKVVIQIVNKGLAEIKLLEMEILENENVQVTTESHVIYVGNIDEDDYESAEVGLHIANDETVVPIKISYRDALNRQYEEQYDLEIRIPSTNSDTGGTSVLTWVVVLVLLGAGIWYWRRRKSKRRK